MFTFGSLFAGIGGLDLGLERAGMTCKFQVEIDPYCRAVLEKHWPNVPRWDDATTFPPDAAGARCGSGQPESGRSIRDETRRSKPKRRDRRWDVDLICGGFPCQPVSQAGRRLGIADARWLWPEFARILGVLRPRYALVENVPGLLAANHGDAMSAILGDLAALGYDAEWTSVPAAAVGAPHLRWRVFIVAYAHQGRWREGQPSVSRQPQPYAIGGSTKAVADPQGFGGQVRESSGERQGRSAVGSTDVADAAQFSQRESPDEENPQPRIFPARLEFGGGSWWSVEPGVGQLVDELPADVARRVRKRGLDLDRNIPRVAKGIARRVPWLKSDGNAVVPTVAQWIGEQILKAEEA